MNTCLVKLTALYKILLFGMIGLFAPQLAYAEEQRQEQGNRVHFSITESEQVANDRLAITFSHTAEGMSPQAVADEINQKCKPRYRRSKSTRKLPSKPVDTTSTRSTKNP